jgi:hypothetical protein
MNLTKFQIVLILLVVVLGLVYFYNNKEPIHNEGTLSIDVVNPNTSQTMNDTVNIDNSQDISPTQNSVPDAQYKYSSYDKGQRGSDNSNLDQFFEGTSPQDDNSGFSPMLENSGKYASYVSDGSNKQLSDKDKFDASNLLPNETNKDWFDDPYEVNAKSSHLINIYRPVGVNTIQTSLKNPSWDLRGTPPNPKYPVSPWSNSSYEPDLNLRGNVLC